MTDRLLVLQASLLLPAVRLGLKLASFERVYSALTRTLPTSTVHPPDLTERPDAVVATVARSVRSAARLVPVGSTCLHRALTLWWLLGRRGLAPTLRLGVRKDGDALLAHAWVEHQGVVVNDEPNVGTTYVPLASVLARDARFLP